MFNGNNLLLYIYHSGEEYLLEGLKVTRFSLNNYLVELDNSRESAWRILAESSGNRSLSIVAGGISTASKAEYFLSMAAWRNSSIQLKLLSESGYYLIGHFLIANYEKFGNLGDEEGYSILFESSGEVDYKIA